MRFTGLLVPLGLVLASTALAAPVQTPHVEAELVSSVRSIEPGKPFTVALRLEHEEHWHTYWKNPGDSGMATSIQWTLPQGFSAGGIQWPAPQRIPILPLTNFGYEGEVFLLTAIQPPADLAAGREVTVEAKAEWLVCKEICLPGGATFKTSLPVASGEAEADPRWEPVLSRVRSQLPGSLSGWTTSASQDGKSVVIRLRPQQANNIEIRKLIFFPDQDAIIENAAEQKLIREGDAWVLRVAAAEGIGARTEIDGLLVAEPGWGDPTRNAAAEVKLPVVAAPPPGGQITLLIALMLALAGGVILNLMPCVFPVVAIKVLGFVEQAHGDRSQLRLHGLTFGLGVLVCFWIVAGMLLALRTSGAALGWGYQLQSPWVVTALAVLFAVLGLNLSGLFEVGARLQTLAGSAGGGHGYRSSFLAGLLATVVATPCTAPFMGAALGYALTQPVAESMLVFTALALGMAAPYVALSFSPALARRLPGPGRWMETLQQLLAFPLYLTVVWLVWVLGKQQGVDASVRLLAGLVLLAAGLWALGRWGVPSVSVRGRALARAAAVALAVAGAAVAWPGDKARAHSPDADGRWQRYSASSLQAARAAGKPVFVDFTAAWCVTCQVNKKLVLESESVLHRFEDRQVILLRADWTSRDPDITAALTHLGRSGVPVYALYTEGSPPRLLPEILTRDVVLGALDVVPEPQR